MLSEQLKAKIEVGSLLCTDDFELFEPFLVYVYTHEGKWVKGTAKLCRENAPSLWVEFDGPIKGGTSGSAIVNEASETRGPRFYFRRCRRRCSRY